MSSKRYTLKPRDSHLFHGVFRGRRLLAFGREQLLDYTADLDVFQAQANPSVWVARDAKGQIDHSFNAPCAEDTMRLVQEAFVSCLLPWQSYVVGGLTGAKKLGPQLVKDARRSA